MKAKKGIWEISKGKGDRHYIRCNDDKKIMHADDLCGMNGLGMYGYENLQDLAMAILRFDKEKRDQESIMNKFNQSINT